MSIQTELNTLSTAISNIKTEIRNKGQTVSSSDTVVSLKAKIEAISNKSGLPFSKNPLKDIIEGTIYYLYDEELTYIRPFCFMGCNNLTIVYFTNLRKLCPQAFDGCLNLKTLVIANSNPTRSDGLVVLENINAFKNTALSNIYVPDNLLTAYRASSGWSNFQIKGISEFSE